ncbi:MAG: hypothetical protein APF84_02780 [Gracilibacter sp. BRH_c7a]|nr:MAG: hypothetical protein APF84_02780 [Gracilibacter sp. BRH_c7a]
MEFKIAQNSTNPRKTYEVIEDEIMFFNALKMKIEESGLKAVFKFTRLSDGTINVDYASYPIGKIKLQGRTKWMMIMKNLYDSQNIKGELHDYIEGINKWIQYIKKYILVELK